MSEQSCFIELSRPVAARRGVKSALAYLITAVLDREEAVEMDFGGVVWAADECDAFFARPKGRRIDDLTDHEVVAVLDGLAEYVQKLPDTR